MDDFITFNDEEGCEIRLRVLADTKIADNEYLLVTEDDADEDELEVMILKFISSEGEEGIYMPLEEGEELESVFKIFEELIEEEED